MWLCSYVAMWLCGYVAMWLCGYVAMWLSGSVAKWPSGPPTSLTVEFLPGAVPVQICSYSFPTINHQLSHDSWLNIIFVFLLYVWSELVDPRSSTLINEN